MTENTVHIMFYDEERKAWVVDTMELDKETDETADQTDEEAKRSAGGRGMYFL